MLEYIGGGPLTTMKSDKKMAQKQTLDVHATVIIARLEYQKIKRPTVNSKCEYKDI